MAMSEKEKEFLEKYRKLCVEYGLHVSACGCCDSPYLIELGRNANSSNKFEEGELLKTDKELYGIYICVYEDGSLGVD